jgi:hypothetical protein
MEIRIILFLYVAPISHFLILVTNFSVKCLRVFPFSQFHFTLEKPDIGHVKYSQSFSSSIGIHNLSQLANLPGIL